MQVDGGAELQLASFMTLALYGGKWSASQPGHLTARRKNSWYPLDKVHLLRNEVLDNQHEMTPPPQSNCRPIRDSLLPNTPFTVSEVFTNSFPSLVDIAFCNPVRADPTPFLLQPESVYHAIPIKSTSATISYHCP
jgi:hypothetical protein